jgi:hypothetical protein
MICKQHIAVHGNGDTHFRGTPFHVDRVWTPCADSRHSDTELSRLAASMAVRCQRFCANSYTLPNTCWGASSPPDRAQPCPTAAAPTLSSPAQRSTTHAGKVSSVWPFGHAQLTSAGSTWSFRAADSCRLWFEWLCVHAVDAHVAAAHSHDHVLAGVTQGTQAHSGQPVAPNPATTCRTILCLVHSEAPDVFPYRKAYSMLPVTCCTRSSHNLSLSQSCTGPTWCFVPPITLDCMAPTRHTQAATAGKTEWASCATAAASDSSTPDQSERCMRRAHHACHVSVRTAGCQHVTDTLQHQSTAPARSPSWYGMLPVLLQLLH